MYVCMYVCMYVAQLVRVCSWRLATSGTFGSEFECGRATYINPLGQGTNIELPLSLSLSLSLRSVRFCLQQVSTASTASVKYIIVTSDTVVLDCRIVITVSTWALGALVCTYVQKMYVCTYVCLGRDSGSGPAHNFSK